MTPAQIRQEIIVDLGRFTHILSASSYGPFLEEWRASRWRKQDHSGKLAALSDAAPAGCRVLDELVRIGADQPRSPRVDRAANRVGDPTFIAWIRSFGLYPGEVA
jgi:hypothetical protein